MEESAPWPVLWVVLAAPLFALLFAGWFAFVVFMIARLGGWHGMARAFGTDVPRPSRVVRTSMRCGAFGRYNGCVYVGALPEGLHLSVMWPFSVGHPPVLIAWGSLRILQQRKNFLGSMTQIAAGDGTKLWFPRQALAGTPLDARAA